MAQSVKSLTLGFGSGHDLRVCGLRIQGKGKGKKNKTKTERKTNYKRPLYAENKLRVAGGERSGDVLNG